MAATFEAQVNDFIELTALETDQVIIAAAADVGYDMFATQASSQETGSFVVGKTPVDEGTLIGSAFTAINGIGTSQGDVAGNRPPDITAGLAGFDAGDTILMAFSSEYAPRIEFGYSDTDSLGRTYNQQGRLMRTTALASSGGWQGRIDKQVRALTGG